MIMNLGGVFLKNRITVLITGLLLGMSVLLQACTPTVKVEPPSEPITINLNIKLDAEVRLKIEEDAKQDIQKNPELF